MKKTVVIVVHVIVVVGVAAGVIAGAVSQYRIYPTYIDDVDIRARLDEPVPVKYDLRVVVAGSNGCSRPWRYCVMRFGHTIFVKILTLHRRSAICFAAYIPTNKTIPLGSCFTPGEKYTVVVNDVVKTFIAIGRGSDKE